MDFLIRANNENDIEYDVKYNAYLNFLSQFDMKKNKDLWIYFTNDFFHDGEIQNLNLSKNMQNLFFNISCPNIMQYDGVEWQYIEPLWFTCLFEGVINFSFESKKIDNYNNPLNEKEDRVIYLESEINTLINLPEDKDKLYSIIIKTLPCVRNFSIIFYSLKVVPVEPLAFELIKTNSNYKIPYYKII